MCEQKASAHIDQFGSNRAEEVQKICPQNVVPYEGDENEPCEFGSPIPKPTRVITAFPVIERLQHRSESDYSEPMFPFLLPFWKECGMRAVSLFVLVTPKCVLCPPRPSAFMGLDWNSAVTKMCEQKRMHTHLNSGVIEPRRYKAFVPKILYRT